MKVSKWVVLGAKTLNDLTIRWSSKRIRHTIHTVITCVFLCFSVANAAIEERQFSNPNLADRYAALIKELRCLVCQNQNLADSNADLAKDLRDKTAEMLIAGKSDKDILNYMSERYGDFVLYRPPFRIDTAALWIGPAALLLFVLLALLRFILRKQKPSTFADNTTDEERARVKQLLSSKE